MYTMNSTVATDNVQLGMK